MTAVTNANAMCLLVLLMVLASTSSALHMQSRVQTGPLRPSLSLTDSDPPSITIEMPSSSDLITNGTYANDTLTLSARVVDSDGVSRVIGSYSNRSDGVWHNVTMHMAAGYPDLYDTDALNYTLRVNTGVIWDIRVYANDTSGASGMSSAFLEVFCLYHTMPSTTTTVPPDLFALTVAAVSIVAVIAVTVFVRRRS